MAAPAVIFDLDGTVWDSLPWFAKTLASIADIDAADALRQLRAGGSIVTIAARHGCPRGRLFKSIGEIETSPKLYPGVARSLRALSDKGTKLGIFTSLPGPLVDALLSRIDLTSLFLTVKHAGNVGPRKPNPAGLIAAAKEMRQACGPEIYYVGDRDVDARTAKKAGMSFAWARYGYEPSEPSFCTVKLATGDEIAHL